MRKTCLVVVCCTLLSPVVASAAAGLSDIAATEACWIRAPFALVKCQSEGGRYPARLVRARPTTPDENSSWSLVPEGYNGIVPLETIVSDVDRVAIKGRHLVARNLAGGFLVIDIDEPEKKPEELATLAAVNALIARQGGQGISESEFRTFESVYREFGPRPSYWMIALASSVVVVMSLVAWFLVRRRIRLNKRLT